MPIPPHAKKVFTGILFNIYQWEQKMFDGTTQTFEMLERPDTVQVIATNGDRIFLANEQQPDKPPFMCLLGGRLEKDEDPLAGAKRELLEESGLSSTDWELYQIYKPQSLVEWNVHVYLARDCKKIAEPDVDPGEKIILKSVSFTEFVEEVTKAGFRGREITEEVLRMQLDPIKMKVFQKKLFS